MDDEPKSPAELKEIRLNRKLAQDAEGIKAMADIAAADIAIRKRTENLRAPDWRRKPPIATSRRNPKPSPRKRRRARCHRKIATAPTRASTRPRAQRPMPKPARATAMSPPKPSLITWRS